MEPEFTQGDIVYISGAMTKYRDTDWGHGNFMAAEEYLHKVYGCRVLNPATSFGSRKDLTLEEYMRMDIHLLLLATGIYVLEDHMESEGSQFEQLVAKKLGLKFVFQV